jgi:hypothetical protein
MRARIPRRSGLSRRRSNLTLGIPKGPQETQPGPVKAPPGAGARLAEWRLQARQRNAVPSKKA